MQASHHAGRRRGLLQTQLWLTARPRRWHQSSGRGRLALLCESTMFEYTCRTCETLFPMFFVNDLWTTGQNAESTYLLFYRCVNHRRFLTLLAGSLTPPPADVFFKHRVNERPKCRYTTEIVSQCGFSVGMTGTVAEFFFFKLKKFIRSCIKLFCIFFFRKARCLVKYQDMMYKDLSAGRKLCRYYASDFTRRKHSNVIQTYYLHKLWCHFYPEYCVPR